MVSRSTPAMTTPELAAGCWARDPDGRLIRLAAYLPSVDCWIGEYLDEQHGRCARAWAAENLMPAVPTEEKILSWLLNRLDS